MADPKHVELVKRGTTALADFWEKRDDVRTSLKLDLVDADLCGIDVSKAHLGPANLTSAKLSESNLSGINLDHADLSGATLDSANLSAASLLNAKIQSGNLESANLCAAELSGASLISASLIGANLFKANLFGTDLSSANLNNADFSFAVLKKAKLFGAKLENATLESTDLESADLRNASGIRFDNNYVRGARFSPHATDPWSKLRRDYTGPKLAFVMTLTLAAFLPFVAKTLFWVGVSKVERQSLPLATTAIAKTLDVLERTPEPHPPHLAVWTRKARDYLTKVEPWLERHQQSGAEMPVETQDVERVIELVVTATDSISSAKQSLAEHNEKLQDAEDRLGQAQHLFRVVRPSGKVKQLRVVELLLGLDQGILPALLVIALLLYNIFRGLLTYFVGPLREEEERTGFTPSWKGRNGYAWLWWTHRVASVLFWVSVASGIYHLGMALSTPVLVPG